jgi:hypothetical protein
MDKLNPDALAESGDDELDAREGVQPVTEMMLYEHIISTEELPPESARPFARWLDSEWNSWNEDGSLTNGEVIAGALAHWRGGK